MGPADEARDAASGMGTQAIRLSRGEAARERVTPKSTRRPGLKWGAAGGVFGGDGRYTLDPGGSPPAWGL